MKPGDLMVHPGFVFFYPDGHCGVLMSSSKVFDKAESIIIRSCKVRNHKKKEDAIGQMNDRFLLYEL